MDKRKLIALIMTGFAAGAVNGLFGAGGGMVLVPLLGLAAALEEQEVFGASIAIILPICIISVLATAITDSLPWGAALPYLAGSAVGGVAAGLFGHRIPAKWLHKGLGILILWGGIRYLC